MFLLEGRALVKSRISVSKKVRLRNPVLIEGLPGMGFVANLSAKYLIRQLKAEKFAEVFSPHFQDMAVASSNGAPRLPTNEMYFWESGELNRDLIILDGNTQPLTVFGQYELSGRILAFSQELGCNFIICLGGLKRETLPSSLQLFGTFTDFETLTKVRRYGVEVMEGKIYGMAGLLLGLAFHRNMRGFCLLAETLGTYPDAKAAKNVIAFLMEYLGFHVDLTELDEASNDAVKVLELLGRTDIKRMEDVFSRF
jgi:uncharacterized protein (TIGR00162 family)